MRQQSLSLVILQLKNYFTFSAMCSVWPNDRYYFLHSSIKLIFLDKWNFLPWQLFMQTWNHSFFASVLISSEICLLWKCWQSLVKFPSIYENCINIPWIIGSLFTSWTAIRWALSIKLVASQVSYHIPSLKNDSPFFPLTPLLCIVITCIVGVTLKLTTTALMRFL